MSHFLPHEEFPVKGINFLSKLCILFEIHLSKIILFWAKYLSKTTIFPHSETLSHPAPEDEINLIDCSLILYGWA